MPVQGIRPSALGLTSGDTSSKWSPDVWQGFPIDAIVAGVQDGYFFEYDFSNLKPSANINAAEAYWDDGFMVFGSDGGVIANVAGVGLSNGSSFGSDGDNEGVGIRTKEVPIRLSRADKMFAFEVVLQTSTVDNSKHGFFVGLMDNTAATATSPIAAAGTLADVNFVGFHRLEGDGDALDLVYKADTVTQVTTTADAVTLAAATDVRLGMTFRPHTDLDNNQNNVFRWWANSKLIATGYKVIPSAAGTDFPNDVAMGFTFNLLNNTASTPGTTTLKRLRIGQVL